MKKIMYAAVFSMLILMPLFWGCGNNDEEYVRVDFSDSVNVEEQPAVDSERPRLRAAVGAMISPRETFESYREILVYLSREMDMDLEFVQRKTYEEINELLGENVIDLAFICSGPYVRGRDAHGFNLLAAPVVEGDWHYYSYLIVNENSPHESLEDLKGKTFAFTDPESNTGRMVPIYWLHEMGFCPKDYFSDLIYTYSHDNSIMAVSKNLVDGAAVDHLIWDYFHKSGSDITRNTRVIKKSQPFGIPPIVASPGLSQDKALELKEILLNMHLDDRGEEILASLLIEKFVAAEDQWYDSIRDIYGTLKNCEDQDAAKP